MGGAAISSCSNGKISILLQYGGTGTSADMQQILPVAQERQHDIAGQALPGSPVLPVRITYPMYQPMARRSEPDAAVAIKQDGIDAAAYYQSAGLAKGFPALAV